MVEVCGRPKRRTGEPCQLPAGHGVPGIGPESGAPCSHHGGQLPRVRLAAARRELLAEARELALDPRFTGSASELMVSHVRATSAHAQLVADAVHNLPDDTPRTELEAWHRLLDRVQQTASDTTAKAVVLNLDERVTSLDAHNAEVVGAAIAFGFRAAFAVLVEEFGDAFTQDIALRMVDAAKARIEALEGLEEEELEQLQKRGGFPGEVHPDQLPTRKAPAVAVEVEEPEEEPEEPQDDELPEPPPNVIDLRERTVVA